ncbi:hypothetical protein [Stieleria varia]|uniref:hypothetical protein n=1 Tax=Stieleria varia TaxID=2528005 RepID=UPI0011B4F2F6|nr:hypothetical protein [Stieleria varia]
MNPDPSADPRLWSSGANLAQATTQSMEKFERRRRLLLMLKIFGIGALVFVTAMMVLAVIDYLWILPDAVRWSLSVLAYALTAGMMWWCGGRELFRHDPKQLARQMEATAPQLGDDLLSAVELADPAAINGSEVFRQRLQGRVARQLKSVDIVRLLPLGLIRRWLLSGTTLVLFCIALMFIPSMQFGRRFARAIFPGIPIERASKTKIEILEPAPPTRYVAERDAVAIIAQVSGDASDEVILRFRTAEGGESETVMLPRIGGWPGNQPKSAKDSTVKSGKEDLPPTAAQLSDELDQAMQSEVFAANLSVGSSPVHYQILSGDAITLWHTLTPLPRPRVIQFEKTYRFPEYAELENRVEVEEHGDLQALQGTVAEMVLTFDQPVQDTAIRFGSNSAEVTLTAVDDEQTKFSATIPIKTSAQYSIDAVSVQSGLNNPFSPLHTITPVVDAVPMVRWGDRVPTASLVSPLQVVSLSASAKDDLPMDQVLQSFSINGEKPQEFPLTIDAPARSHELSWKWDLMDRLASGEETPKLKSGDIVQVKLVAVDRKMHRSESLTIEILVADDGFDAERHNRLEALREQTAQVLAWTDAVFALSEKLRVAAEKDDSSELGSIVDAWPALQESGDALNTMFAAAISDAENVADANTIETTARAISDLQQRMTRVVGLSRPTFDNDQPQWQKERKRRMNQIMEQARHGRYQSERLERLVRGNLSLELSAAMYVDTQALASSLKPLLQEDSPIPNDRIGRYLNVIVGRLGELDRLVQRHSEQLLQSTADHLRGEQWLRWSERWAIQLQKTIEDNPGRENYLAVVRALDEQLQSKRHDGIDGRIWDTLRDAYKDLRREAGFNGDWVRNLRDYGAEKNAADEAATKEDDADKVIEATRTSEWMGQAYSLTRTGLLQKLEREQTVHRKRPIVDLRYAADLNLMSAAVTNTTSSGFVPFKDEPAEEVFGNVRKAMRVIEASQDLAMYLSELRTLSAGEHAFKQSADMKIKHPAWFMRLSNGVEWAMRALQSDGLDNEIVGKIDQIRWNDDHNASRDRIERRRWSREEFIAADAPLDRMINDLQDALMRSQPMVESARETLSRYVPTLVEQAKKAAEKAREAKKETDERENANAETTEKLAEKQTDALEAAEQALKTLMDQANNADITDQEQRELARDADAAAAMIEDALSEAREALDETTSLNAADQRNDAFEQTEQKLEKLAESLEQTAEHFEKADAGEDLQESREQLRAAEEELRVAQELEERYEQAERLADAAQQSPQSLMDQLLDELSRNPKMQAELSEIAKDTAEAAQRQLEQAARDEQRISERLETADPVFQEQKNQIKGMLEELDIRTQSVKNELLETAQQAADWANTPDASKKVQQAREALDQAVQAKQQVNDQSTLAEMQDAAAEMQAAIQQAARATEDAAKQSEQKQDENIHGDDKKRNQAEDSLKRNANNLRNRQSQSLNRQRQTWNNIENQAKSRERAADSRKRQLEGDQKRTNDAAKKDPENQSLKDQQARIEKEIAEQERTAEAAKQTQQLAKERIADANQRSKDLEKNRVNELDKPNPAAELAERTSQNATEQLKELTEELAEIAKSSQIADQLQTPERESESLQRNQQQITEDIAAAQEDLERAARHEERLGNESAAEMLNQAAQAVNESAVEPAENAGEKLESAADDAGQSPEASKAVAQAQEKIAEQAQKLGEMLEQASQAQQAAGENVSQQQSGQQQGEPSGEQSSQQSSQQSGEQPSGEQSSQQSGKPAGEPTGQQPAQPNDSSPSGESPSGESPSSGQPSGESASPADGESQSDQRAREMAQTLDELDQAMSAQARQQAAAGDPSSQQEGQPQDGQPQDGQGQQAQGQPQQGQPQQGQASQGQSQSGQSQSGQGQTAMDVSPTLAQKMNDQMQQAARERLQQMQQATGEASGHQSGSDSSSEMMAQSDGSSANGTTPGAGEGAANDGTVNTARTELMDGDWGDLRSQRSEDASQGRAAQVAPQYRKEVQAYFKAIARRAAEKRAAENAQ